MEDDRLGREHGAGARMHVARRTMHDKQSMDDDIDGELLGNFGWGAITIASAE